ncbi:MAG: GlsB/YeaQ/YmgE family stress response membrane protein [Anaerolineae bacterium]|nr:GlsB/YeaQ/YmgE family stress response membrane protein [Anaerolineae bacterium]MDQ7034678.1 GlsB/YeaQ/YmgE family stress response membrane protein [Anaerolineae bacterium]
MGTVFFVVMFALALTLVTSLGGIVQLLIAMLVWMFVGNIAGQLIRGEDYGVVGNIALGLAGGFVGTHLFNFLGWHSILGLPIIGFIITGVVGAVVFIFMMRLVDKNFAR